MFGRLLKSLNYLTRIFPPSAFKVVGVTGSTQNKSTQIIYQVCGKATIATEKPDKLLEELMLIKGFSKADTNLIYGLAASEKLTPSFRILSIQFEDQSSKFEIEDVHSQYSFFLTAREIFSSTKIFEDLSSRDLTMIYFQLLKENEYEEKMLKSQLLRSARYERRGSVYFLKSPGVVT